MALTFEHADQAFSFLRAILEAQQQQQQQQLFTRSPSFSQSETSTPSLSSSATLPESPSSPLPSPSLSSSLSPSLPLLARDDIPKTPSPSKTPSLEPQSSSKTLSPPKKGRKFKGIRRRKWGKVVCEIRGAQGKRIWLGSYDTEEVAARVYDEAARILQGDRAWLNFPGERAGAVQLPGSTVETLRSHRDLMLQKKTNSAASKTQNVNAKQCARSLSLEAGSPDAQTLPAAAADSSDDADVSSCGEWEILVSSLQDPAPSLWMEGVGPISPESSEDRRGLGEVDLIPELNLDSEGPYFDSPLSSCSSQSSASADVEPQAQARLYFEEDWMCLPPLSDDIAFILSEGADALL